MPIIINEIIIRSNIETPTVSAVSTDAAENLNLIKAEIVKQAVEKVLEILNDKKQR